jgi:condensin complex subunit 3
MAFKLQEEYNLLEELTPADEIDQDEPLPIEYVERTFVVAELCKMAVNLDYSDEIGRRKMFQLARKFSFLQAITILMPWITGEMISQRTLPETIIPLCLDVLYKISDGERDLIRVIVDVVTELRVGPGDVSRGVTLCLHF